MEFPRALPARLWYPMEGLHLSQEQHQHGMRFPSLMKSLPYKTLPPLQWYGVEKQISTLQEAP